MSDHDELLKDLGLDVELHHKIFDSIDRNFRKTVLAQKDRPERMAYFDGVIHGAHGARVREIVDRRAAGDKFIGTFCVYVPDELILALGAVPMALCGGTSLSIPYAEKMLPRDICPLVKSTLGLALSNTCPYGPIEDLAVGETTCDAKKKTWDILRRGGGFPRPRGAAEEGPPRQGPLARGGRPVQGPARRDDRPDARAGEARRGRPPDEQEAAGPGPSQRAPEGGEPAPERPRRPRRHAGRPHRRPAPVLGEARSAERRARGPGPPGRRRRPGGAKRIMVSGCPSVMGNWKLHHLIESAGAVVVCDETCTGTRYFSALVEERDGDLDAQIAAIAARYLEIDCSCFSPNDERIASVVRLARDYRVDGVVQYVLQYCHTYNVEAVRVASALKESGVPSLKIVTDYSEEDTGQLRIRVEAFLEGLSR